MDRVMHSLRKIHNMERLATPVGNHNKRSKICRE
jgi:hypothetical protein